MKKSKKGVKKCKATSAAYAAGLQLDKEVWTMKVIAWTEMNMLDTMALTLAAEFGYGPERLKRFHDAFEAKYSEIRELEREDTADNEYAIAKQEEALKRAYGKYYTPRKERYDIKIIDREGREHHFE